MKITKRTLAATALALSALALAAPAQADDDTNVGSGVNAANNWNFTAADVCVQELAVVPVGAPWAGDTTNTCTNGNVLAHSRS
ncbi:hypothetical protein [Streptomyces lutosisoli]|uniref:Chaplin domain-containing protein n=1 Tax=Streptomyces lutosisoli TaxID=2665721 RepID=A0ABW2VK09_9ACTN